MDKFNVLMIVTAIFFIGTLLLVLGMNIYDDITYREITNDFCEKHDMKLGTYSTFLKGGYCIKPIDEHLEKRFIECYNYKCYWVM